MSEKEHKKLQKNIKAQNKERQKAIRKGKEVSGKGDKVRPMDLEKYRDNFDKIFGSPEMKKALAKPGMEDLFEEEGQIIKKNKREVKVIKKYVTDDNITMYVININNNLTNTTVTEAKYLTLINECNRGDIVDITPEEVSKTPPGTTAV